METHVYRIALRTRFRGITAREGMVIRGEAGWAEWSPFVEYDDREASHWLRAALETAELGHPEGVRSSIPVNVTIPAVDHETAHRMASASGCRTAKVKVAEPGQTLSDDLDRVEAVRDALGPSGKVRVDANGGWDVATAVEALRQLGAFDLEYAEQPCASVEQLAELRRELVRRNIEVPIAADESIRKADDPLRVKQLGAADIAVLKVQPLGGVRACLRIAEQIDLPVVVSSALESSVGIRMSLALASALPRLDHACGLNTVALFANDLVASPLVAVDGSLPVSSVEVDEAALDRCAAPPERRDWWLRRLERVMALVDGTLR